MAASPVTITLSVGSKKSAATRASGSTADGNVIIEYDKTQNQLDTIAAIEYAKEIVIEQYLDAAS